MFKFIKHYTETIHGVEIYGIISLIIFVTFFVGLLIYLYKADKTLFKQMGELPLDGTIQQS